MASLGQVGNLDYSGPTVQPYYWFQFCPMHSTELHILAVILKV